MFDISWGELLLIGVVALIVIGPKELPAVLRTVGQWMTKLRRMANEFQGQFQEAIREAEMADLKKEVDDLATQAKSYTHFDPLADVQKEIEKTMADKPAEAATAVTEQPAEAAAMAETPPVETIASEPAITGRTPADAAVESAMRAVAELNAEMPVPDAGGDFAAPPAPAAAAPPPRRDHRRARSRRRDRCRTASRRDRCRAGSDRRGRGAARARTCANAAACTRQACRGGRRAG